MDLPQTQDAKAALDLTPFYGLIGAVVVAQFSAILGAFIGVFKIGVWKGRNDLIVELMQKDLNAAHTKLRNGHGTNNEGEKK
jgi:hypothetical protein